MSSGLEGPHAVAASPLAPAGARDDARAPVGAVVGSDDQRWRLVSPAPYSAALALAGAHAHARRKVLEQVRTDDSTALYRGDEPIALAMFRRHGWRRTEVCFCVAREGRRHALQIVRFAQLTLVPIAETGRAVIATVAPANLAGQKLARAIGFTPARLKRPGYWIMRRFDG